MEYTKKHFKTIGCPLCRSRKYQVMYPSTLTEEDFSFERLVANLANTSEDYTKHAQIVRCQSCTLVYTNPREDTQMISEGYEEVIDEEYLKTEKYRKLLLTDHLAFVMEKKKKGKILDIGSFAGFFLELAKKRRWTTYGIEPSVWATKLAKKKGIKDLGRDVYASDLPKNYFDVITLWDVIEHLPEPNLLIQKLYGALKQDGVLAIATPNIDSLYAQLLGKRCPFLIRMHIVLYSPQTLQLLLEKHGFRIIKSGYYGRTYPISYIIDRLQIKNPLGRVLLLSVKRLPIIANLMITHNFHDSYRILAKKV